MEQLFLKFKERLEKEHNLVESVCLSDKNGIIWKEQYIPRTVRNIYSHSKSFTSLMVGIAFNVVNVKSWDERTSVAIIL